MSTVSRLGSRKDKGESIGPLFKAMLPFIGWVCCQGEWKIPAPIEKTILLLFVCAYVCLCVCLCIPMCVSMYAFVCVCMYVYLCLCVPLCVTVYVVNVSVSICT